MAIGFIHPILDNGKQLDEITDVEFYPKDYSWELYFFLVGDEEARVGTVPARPEECGKCRGSGKVPNPGIGAISGEDFAHHWSPEEQEDYIRGAYDVDCPCCKGYGLVPVPVYDKVDPDVAAVARYHFKSQADTRHAIAHELAMGA